MGREAGRGVALAAQIARRCSEFGLVPSGETIDQISDLRLALGRVRGCGGTRNGVGRRFDTVSLVGFAMMVSPCSGWLSPRCVRPVDQGAALGVLLMACDG